MNRRARCIHQGHRMYQQTGIVALGQASDYALQLVGLKCIVRIQNAQDLTTAGEIGSVESGCLPSVSLPEEPDPGIALQVRRDHVAGVVFGPVVADQ